MVTFKDLPDTSTPLNATNLNGNFNELSTGISNLEAKTSGIIETRVIDLCTNEQFGANSSNSGATTSVPQISGYKAIFVVLENEWWHSINLWYCNLSSDGTTISWRAGNNGSSSRTATIRVKILYIKNSLL